MENKNQKIEDAVIISGDDQKNFVDETVKKEVGKFDLADSEISKLIERANGLTVSSVEEVEKYEEIKSLYREFVSTRTAIDKKRKEINKPFDDVIKGVNAKGAEYTKKLAPFELALNTEKNKFEAWQTEEEERAEKEATERLNARVEELKISGLEFNNESGLYEVGEDISLDIVTIKKLSEFDFKAVNEKIKIARKKIDEKIEADRIAKEEEEKRQKEIADKNEKDRREIRDEKLELRSGKLTDLGFKENVTLERFEYAKNKVSALLTFDAIAEMSSGDFKDTVKHYSEIIAKAEADKKAEDRENAKILELSKRTTTLRSLNIEKDGEKFSYKNVELITEAEVKDLDLDFAVITAKLSTKIAEINKIEADNLEAEKKRKADAVKKRKAEALPDLDKIERYLKEIQAIDVPQMKTDAGVKLLEELTGKIRVLSDEFINLISNIKN